MKKQFSLFLAAAFLLAGCSASPKAETVTTVTPAETISGMAVSDLFSSRDLNPSVDIGSAVRIDLQDTVTIDSEGVYILSGTLEDGQVIVDAKKAKVQLVLDGVSITSASSAAIYCKSADKLFVTLADGSENTLVNSGSYEAADSNIDSVIFSKSDLTLNGSGTLIVHAAAGHGIVSKDELVITGGTYIIDAAEHGMTGKDGISIADGSFTITSGEDGIHSSDAEAGFVYIGNGSFDIASGEDGISATGPLQIDGGEFRITTFGGSSAVQMRPSDAMGTMGWRGMETETYGTENSAKGIKSDGALLLNGGSFTLDCADDAIHSGGSLTITGGSFELRTADDGIHSDADIYIRNGTISIPYCYEGIEGRTVNIDGGTINILAGDDGINAAGGMDGPGMNRPGEANPGNHITVNGGTITIESEGDCLDSNGALILNGGKLVLTCQGNGNTALDCDGNFTNNGADVTTNDGSENGTGFGKGFGGFGHGGQRPDGFNGKQPDGFGGSQHSGPMQDGSIGPQPGSGTLPQMPGAPGQPPAAPEHGSEA